jgi:hypothetical protein
VSLGRTFPRFSLTPEVEHLPDDRKAYTRFREIAGPGQITEDLVDQLAFGAEDPNPLFPDATNGPRLVGREIGVGPDGKSYEKLRFEQLHVTAEVQVGGATTGNTKITLEDGRTAIVAEFLQLAAGTYTPGTVGSTTAPGDTSAFLQKAEMSHNGTLRKIKRTYVYAGLLDQRDETRNNGALLLRTLTYAKTTPPTPTGYTSIQEKQESPNGFPVYTYTFAKGNGQISQDDDTQNNGALLLRTIRHLVAPSTANPIATPAGYTSIKESFSEQDGHRIWSQTFAKGNGQVSQDDDTQNNGALLLRTIRHLVAPSTANPIATPAGYTSIKETYTEQDGHRIWSQTFAKGNGEISRAIDYLQSSDQGTTGITRTTIRHLVAPSASVQPTSLAGSVEVGRSNQDVDGHRIWTTTWAKGAGQVVDESSLSNAGRLVLYHRVKLGGAPTTPSATIGGTVTLIASATREAEGHVVYDYRWAEGTGTVSDSFEEKANGRLIVYDRTELNASAAYIPAAPASRISGPAITTLDAAFGQPGGMVLDSAGNLYVSNTSSGNISKYTPAGVKSTFASGFTTVKHIAIDSSGNIYAADSSTNVVSKITPAGVKTTLVTTSGEISGVAVDSYDYIFVSHVTSGNISRITPAGSLSTFATGLSQPVALAIDPSDNLYVLQDTSGWIRKITPTGSASNFAAVPYSPYWDIAFNPADSCLYVAQTYGISRINASGTSADVLTAATTGTQPRVIAIASQRQLCFGAYIPAAAYGNYRYTAKLSLLSQRRENGEGCYIYRSQWCEGQGLLSEKTETRNGGLLLLAREILVLPDSNDISDWTPAAGILVLKEYVELEGHRRFTAVWMQKLDGTSPTSGTAASWEDYVPFRYPGRAKIFSVAFTTGGYTSHRARDVLLSPPVDCMVLATTAITYQTSSSVGSLTNSLWNPSEWATLRARWIAWANAPRSKVEGLPGYTVADNAVTGSASSDAITLTGHNFVNGDEVVFMTLTGGAGLTAGTTYYVRDVAGDAFKLAATSGGSAIDITTDVTAPSRLRRTASYGTSGGTGLDTSVLGDRVYASTDWLIALSGGPVEPGGTTWTLNARVEPAFVGYDGTQYYRKTVVSAAIPAQAALPV